MKCQRFLVSGRVQGVFFRQSTLEQAHMLKLTGTVRNLDDGRVEVIACGDPSSITQLEQWLHDGPRLARVNHVEIRDRVAQPSFVDFNVI